jgi:hypothetical protein
VRIVTLADGDVNKMLVAVKGLLGSLFLDDLAQKTKRGQVGRVKAGRIPGGRCYGYDVVRDGQEGGKRTINEAEAGIVRRIYAEYVDGRSPLKIVQALNAERVPGPRGGHWNVSALIGSAKRRNSLLNNSLYAGRITYNRQRFIKDPATGRRQARANPQDQWLTQDVPELAIVGTAVFENAQDLRAARIRPHPVYHRRPKHLLSGLLVCGSCGASMIVRNRKGNVTSFGCSARINRNGCDNARSVNSVEIEARVLAALRSHLLQPDVVATAIEAYRIERQRLSREAAKVRAALERELAEIDRKARWLVGEIENGRGSQKVSDRLYELETREQVVRSQLALANGPDVVELHPQAAERYAAKVADIHAALSRGDEAGHEAIALVRELVTRVRVVPTPRGEAVGLEIAGDLAALLGVNEEGPIGMAKMVAGARSPLCYNNRARPKSYLITFHERSRCSPEERFNIQRVSGKTSLDRQRQAERGTQTAVQLQSFAPTPHRRLQTEDGHLDDGNRAACQVMARTDLAGGRRARARDLTLAVSCRAEAHDSDEYSPRPSFWL